MEESAYSFFFVCLFFGHQTAAFCIFGLRTGVNGHTGPWTVKPDLWSYFWYETPYLLLVTPFILQVECTFCLLWWVSQWENFMPEKTGQAVCGLLSILQQKKKKGQRFDPYSSRTLWLWMHELGMPGLYMSNLIYSAFSWRLKCFNLCVRCCRVQSHLFLIWRIMQQFMTLPLCAKWLPRNLPGNF